MQRFIQLLVLALCQFDTCTAVEHENGACNIWETFGEGGISTETELTNNGWSVKANHFNSDTDWNPNNDAPPDRLAFFNYAGSNKNLGWIEKGLPLGGDFVLMRYGFGGKEENGRVELSVGGSVVGKGGQPDDFERMRDMMVTAPYSDNDKIKLAESGSVIAHIWSIHICNYDHASTGACFHGDGTLLLESGATKKFSELSIGDVIKTSNGQGVFSFSPVLSLPHKNNTEAAAFLSLTTETGKKVDMTSDHFIPKCDEEEVAAGELVVGDCLITADGKEVLMEISSTAKAGVFTAITQDKFIIVDGIVASPFSKDSDPAKPELDYNKYRLELEEKRERKLSYHAIKHQKRVQKANAN